ncbi:MAG TPA: SpoIID/LytB domain-containing protein [Gemmatimonadaceae bacterium]|nr:SpoIID/LytB domain-containing protein [Gemmatimonadaceae bacterium]
MTRRKLLTLLFVAACTTPASPAPVVNTSPTAAASPASPPRSARPASAPPATPNSRTATNGAVRDVGDTTIRVLLGVRTAPVVVSAPSGLIITDRAGGFMGRTFDATSWRLEHDGRMVRAVRMDGTPTTWADGPVYARPTGNGLLDVGGKPYRGDVAFYAADSGVMIVNVVRIDDYLPGVVPLEIGTRAESDSAAVQAQAVSARSYAYTHVTAPSSRYYDITAGTLDQVYGGAAAESPVGSEAVESTRALVLKYAGRVVNAPYHSTCGGATAAASELWRSNDEPYLQSVSDQIPGTSRYYCDIAPRFHWTRTLEAATLNAALARYLATYSKVPNGRVGVARDVFVGGHTASGRVATTTISTDRGSFVVRGNDIRYVLRAPGGETLNSTHFLLETVAAADGSLARLIIHGNGYGHGVGMCQWGAIGRARAGQDFRTILGTYYPGTTVGPASADDR